jgi:Carboxypeptidase regulatory-like domain
MISRRVCSLVLALGVLFSTCIFVQGQFIYGSIRESVTGPFGAAIADARVALTDLGTVEPRSQPTGSDRLYWFVIPGDYRIEVEKPGFKLITQEPVVLQVQQMSKIDVSLPVGQATVTVEVTPEIPSCNRRLLHWAKWSSSLCSTTGSSARPTALASRRTTRISGWYQHD